MYSNPIYGKPNDCLQTINTKYHETFTLLDLNRTK